MLSFVEEDVRVCIVERLKMKDLNMKRICKNPDCDNELVDKRDDAVYCDNKCRLKYQKNRWYHSHKDDESIKKKKYYQSNREEILLKMKESYIPSIKVELTEEERITKREKRKEYDRVRALRYYYNNKKDQNKKKVDRDKRKMKSDPLFKLAHNIRTLIRLSMKNQFTTKSKKTIEILGCSFEEFYKHLESKFDENMNWDNQGSYWHIDHIKPISLAKNEKEVYELNHYTNFQPLYWEDNLAKSNKFEEKI